MTSPHGVRSESQQLRDIEDLIARLNDVNRLLALPVRAMTPPQGAAAPEPEHADAPSA